MQEIPQPEGKQSDKPARSDQSLFLYIKDAEIGNLVIIDTDLICAEIVVITNNHNSISYRLDIHKRRSTESSPLSAKRRERFENLRVLPQIPFWMMISISETA